MKTDCNLIKDILLLYVKGETSRESNAIIEEHLNECTDCRELQKALSTEDTAAAVSERDRSFGKSMKKVKRRIGMRIIAAVMLAIVIISGVFVFGFWGVVPVKSTDVKIVPEAFIVKNEDGTDLYMAEFHLTLLKSDRCIDLRHGLFNNSEGPDNDYEITVYSQLIFPFDDRGKNPECFDAGASFAKLTGEEKVVFHFRDKDVEYNVKDLFEGAGS